MLLNYWIIGQLLCNIGQLSYYEILDNYYEILDNNYELLDNHFKIIKWYRLFDN